MEFEFKERTILTEMVENTADSLFNTMKYVYVISESDFYNISCKDIFKVALSDVTNSNILNNLGIQISDSKIGEMASEEFGRVRSMIHYAFIIRLPFLKRAMEFCPLKENHLKDLYALAIKRGAENFGEIIEEDFKTMLKISRNRLPEPPFDGEWFRRWIYTRGKELSLINNRNMFLLGCMDAMFPLYYSALTEKLTTTLLKWQEL
ncbi:MAG: hypothetical protein FWH08_05385 [Oscillospiraceae bacterium]|nr:hypothetical protein [Oscillospiraceae bacterium]